MLRARTPCVLQRFWPFGPLNSSSGGMQLIRFDDDDDDDDDGR